uniref:Uncharacterized protein n=1 Tax=viral metagenome TaxID=1070528 RepID=A0A6M3X6Q9_9ZZZZ
MGITITIDGKEPRDENRQIVYFTFNTDSEAIKFTDGSVPVELDTEAKILKYLKANKERYHELILGKQQRIRGYEGYHPFWIEKQKQLDKATTIEEIKNILKKER